MVVPDVGVGLGASWWVVVPEAGCPLIVPVGAVPAGELFEPASG